MRGTEDNMNSIMDMVPVILRSSTCVEPIKHKKILLASCQQYIAVSVLNEETFGVVKAAVSALPVAALISQR